MENENKNFVKEFDAPAVQYGDYLWCNEDQIEETKEVLLEQMFETIREIAKKDEFWIIKKADANNPLTTMGCPIADMDKAYTVGWKVAFDQMAPKEYHTNDATAEKKPVKIVPVFDFGGAIKAMKNGERVARMGWNGKGMYVFLAYEPDFVTDADISAFDQLEVEVADMLVMKTAQDTFQPGWLASQADMLAEDWYIV